MSGVSNTRQLKVHNSWGSLAMDPMRCFFAPAAAQDLLSFTKLFCLKPTLLCLLLFAAANCLAQSPEERLAKMNIVLNKPAEPIASYVHVVRVGNLFFLSGKGPQQPGGEYIKGKLGADLTIEQGYEAARLTAINQLAVLKGALGELSKVKRIVKVNGYVNSTPEFFDHPKVINGFSDLMIEVFGEKGRHARTSLGVAALPVNMAVEIEMIVEVE